MGINLCRECLKKKRRIDALLEENQRPKQKLKYQERKEKEGFFGSATSSAKVPAKANTAKPEAGKRKGAQRGHKGVGRKAFPEGEADRVVTGENSLGPQCPDCGRLLEEKGMEERLVIESRPLKAQRVIYPLPKKYCPHCQKVFQVRAPAVLPKSLFGNQSITTAAVMHYLHGIPMGRVCEQTEMGPGSMVEIFHRLARLFEKIPAQLIEEYRQAPVKHADETTWRTEGQNGHAWLFATKTLSLFQFRKSRSASVPQAVFGEKPLPGVLIVDRLPGPLPPPRLSLRNSS
jgi:transposase